MRIAPLAYVALGELAVLAGFWAFMDSALVQRDLALIGATVALALALVAVPFLVPQAPARAAVAVVSGALLFCGHILQKHEGFGVVSAPAQALFWDTVWLMVAPSLALYAVTARRSAALPKDTAGRGLRVWREIGLALAMATATLLLYKYGINGESMP